MPLHAITKELAGEIARDYPALAVLNLSRNRIRTVENLAHLPRTIASIDLSMNQLAGLGMGLAPLAASLTELNVSSNQLTTLSGMYGRCIILWGLLH
jgi:Leucine-rich repeat (LRR) protein